MSSTEEVSRGERFAFGANWRNFLDTLNDERVALAENSLREMLGVDLAGKRFLDAGSGSGLFSLAARRLGATVHSFDYDPDSVACAEELKRRYFDGDDRWTIGPGSVLDAAYVASLGTFDVVYSWGVLHHTGHLWDALATIAPAAAPGGLLFVSIYNDQGWQSRAWTWVKRTYCSGPVGERAITAAFFPGFMAMSVAAGIARHGHPLGDFRARKKRGMSPVHNWRDWLGGYPFEVARPEQIFSFYQARGFVLERMKTTNHLGCNELVFRRVGTGGAAPR